MRLSWILGMAVVAGAIGCKAPAPVQQTQGPGGSSTEGQAPQSQTGEGETVRTGRRRHGRGGARAEAEAVPGQFDFYLLNLSWSPEYCATHAGAAECKQHLGFVVHGLWPQDFSGSYPEDCGDQPGPADPGAWADIYPDASLLQHEWQTHGTCSGLAAAAFLGEVRQAFQEVKVPGSVNGVAAGTMMAPAAILDAFQQANPGFPAGSIALSCGNNQLTAIEVCMTKSLQAEACQGVRSCRANVVKITPRN